MVIIMDMASGDTENLQGEDVASETVYAEDVLMAGFTAVPAEWRTERQGVMPRLAEVVAEAKADDPDAYMHRVYAAQGLPGRKP